MYTYQREPHGECARSWTHRSPELDETGGNYFSPSSRHKLSHRFPSSKRKQQDEVVEETATELKLEIVLYH